MKAEHRIKWWKMNKEECCTEVRRSSDVLWVVQKSYHIRKSISKAKANCKEGISYILWREERGQEVFVVD